MSNLLSINIRVTESYCIRLQTSRESNLENRTRRSKIKRIGISVIRHCPITDNYMFLHDKNNQSDNNYNFLHSKIWPIKLQLQVLHASHSCNYGLIAWRLANKIPVILHSMQLNAIIDIAKWLKHMLDVQLKQSKCMISAVNVNKSGSFYAEIRWPQIKLSLMLGLERAYEMFTSSITTIHTTHVQEPERKDAGDVSSCLLSRNTRTVKVEAINAKQMVYEWNLMLLWI